MDGDEERQSEGPEDEPGHDDEPAEGHEEGDVGDDTTSSRGTSFRIDPDLDRAFASYQREMSGFYEQLQPSLEIATRAAKAAEPALRAYKEYADRIGAEVARIIGPAIESIARATTVLDKIDWVALLDSMRASLPPNWDESVDVELIESIINDEGIPLVFVPNNSILNKLLVAENRAERVAILLQNKEEVLRDCQSTLASVTHTTLAGQLPLAKDAVASCQDGHAPSGQALAVSIVETIVSNILGMNYGQAKQKLVLDLDDLPYTQVRVKAALAPIPKFYTSWYPKGGIPPPAELSRHVSIHQADVQHYTEENALIASMLVASVMRAVDESQHEVQPEPTSG